MWIKLEPYAFAVKMHAIYVRHSKHQTFISKVEVDYYFDYQITWIRVGKTLERTKRLMATGSKVNVCILCDKTSSPRDFSSSMRVIS